MMPRSVLHLGKEGWIALCYPFPVTCVGGEVAWPRTEDTLWP
jgi:hypothetical protein